MTAPAMDARRLKVIGKLGLLFGLPLLLVLTLFGGGVYWGHAHRHGITSFERDWLGLDVEVPPAPKKDDEAKEDDETEKDDAGNKDDEEKKEDGAEKDDAGKQDDEPSEPDSTADEPTERADDGDDTSAQPVPEIPQTKADPLEGDLAQRLALPVTVHVKVLVDEALIDEHPAWIDYVQRTVSQASSVYEKQFGIELQLVSVGRWPVATDGMSSQQLLDDIEGRPREGAEILVGFTNRPLDDQVAGRGEQPSADSPFNGAYGVVYAVPDHRNAHLRTFLHEVGHMFGAHDVLDPQDPDFRAGSWMSYAPVPETQAPWIDTQNRKRILDRKDKPFRPEK